MSKDLFENFAAAREFFQKTDESLGVNLPRLHVHIKFKARK